MSCDANSKLHVHVHGDLLETTEIHISTTVQGQIIIKKTCLAS